MTEVRLKNENNVYRIECRGHATGSEETCSAISALVYALKGYLDNGYGGVKKRNTAIGDGYIDLEFSGGAEAEAVFDIVALGLMQLEDAYDGEYVRIKEKIGGEIPKNACYH